MISLEAIKEIQEYVVQCVDRKLSPNSNVVANYVIMGSENIITLEDTDEMFVWNKETGLYETAEKRIEATTQNGLQNAASTHLVNEIIANIKRKTRISRKQMNPPLELIPLENGIYNFKQKTLQPYSDNYYFFKKHPIKYVPPIESLEYNPIDYFVEDVTGSQEDALFLKEIIGYCYYRAMPFQSFFLLVGSGANGKSVFLNVVRNMLGQENVSNRSLQSLTENRFAPASLYDKNANIFGDLEKKAIQDTGILKQITGDDPVEAEQKFKEPFKFLSYAKILASCNEAPETPDLTDAFFRRVEQIVFPKSFIGKEKRNLTQELCTPDNLSAFFNTCIDAFSMALENNGFIRIETVAQKREKYINYSNSAMAFCLARLEYDPDSEIEMDSIFQAYKKFCEEKLIPIKQENYFFQGVYKYFGHKVYKKRKRDDVGGESRRWFVIVGVDWRENK